MSIYKLTPEEIKSVRYTKKGVRELLLSKNSRLNNATKITKIIKDSITYNEFIKNDKLVTIINNAYRKLGIDKQLRLLILNSGLILKMELKDKWYNIQRILYIKRKINL